MLVRFVLSLVVVLLFCGPSFAHRDGESYVYVDVSDTSMSGEVHIRLTDLQKAVNLDSDGDGTVTEDEFGGSRPLVETFLSERLAFYSDGVTHLPAFGDHHFFGERGENYVVMAFDLPSLGPPPDQIDVEFRMLYDGADPSHRPMLLQASNTRLRLDANESIESLVFAPGSERQELDLQPRPVAEIFGDFLLHGTMQVLRSLPYLCFAAVLLLPVVLVRQPGKWEAGATARSTNGAGVLTVVLVGLGYAIGSVLVAYAVFKLGHIRQWAAFTAAIALLALDNWRPIPLISRAPVILLAGGLLGMSSTSFENLLGLDRGFQNIALLGFVIGVWLAFCLAALALVPLLGVARNLMAYRAIALRVGSVMLAVVGAGLFALYVDLV